MKKILSVLASFLLMSSVASAAVTLYTAPTEFNTTGQVIRCDLTNVAANTVFSTVTVTLGGDGHAVQCQNLLPESTCELSVSSGLVAGTPYFCIFAVTGTANASLMRASLHETLVNSATYIEEAY